jgi:uncharacterized protein
LTYLDFLYNTVYIHKIIYTGGKIRMAVWKREIERQQLWRMFDRGKNVALFAPRRLGKTWLMKTLEHEAKLKGYNAVFIDLEAETTTKDAVRKLCKKISEKHIFASLWRQACSRLTSIVQGDTMAGNYQELLLKADWESLLSATLKALDDADKPSLILIDEISVCLASLLAVNKTEGTALMRRLREHRETYTNIRWMLTGSMGLDHVAEQYGLGGTLNELEPFPLMPFTTEQARAYVDDLCSSRKLPLLNDEAHQQMQRRLGWLAPHYLSRLLDRIEDLVDNKTATLEDVDTACNVLLSYPYHRVFSDWPDHINRNYPDTQKITAHKLLKILCKHLDGETIDTLRNTPQIADSDINTIGNTLTSLENDGFLHRNTDTKRYSFVFGLLREYWMRYQSI